MDFITAQPTPRWARRFSAEYDRQQQQHRADRLGEHRQPRPCWPRMGTVLTNKYAEGYPGKRYYGGCQCVDVVEDIARRAGLPALRRRARQCTAPLRRPGQLWRCISPCCQPGDTVLGMNLANGGHLTHGSPVNISGKYYNIVPYGVTPETEPHRLRPGAGPGQGAPAPK